MSRFTIRVVLHNATFEHYVDLASKLAKQRVVDVIQADNGQFFRLPPAEYYYEGNVTAQQVLAGITSIAATVVPSYQVFVTEGNVRVWDGLPSVAQAPANSPFARRSA